MSIDNPLSSAQMSVVGLVVALVIVSVAAPMMLSPGTTSPATNNGTTYSGPSNTTTATNTSAVVNRGWGQVNVSAIDLSPVPDSHVNDTDRSGSPTVSSTKGTQTLRVQSMTQNGSAALNLTDDQTEGGRWVSVSGDWLDRHHGGIPEIATVEHESGDTYTTRVRNRSGEAMFYVQEFSTNIVTFGGSVELVDQPAVSGTTHIYEVRDLDNSSAPVVELTGAVNTERDISEWNGLLNGDSVPLSIAGGGLEPTNAEATFTGEGNSSSASATGTGSGTVLVEGNALPENQQVSISGQSSTVSDSDSGNSISLGGSDSISVGGNIDPINDEISVTGNAGTTTYNPNPDGGADSIAFIGDDASGSTITAEFELVPSESGQLTGFSIPVESDYVDGPDPTAGISISEGGISDTSSFTTVKDSWQPSGGSTVSVSFDSDYAVQAGTTYTLKINTQTANNDDYPDGLQLAADDGSGRSTSDSGYGGGEAGYANIDYNIEGSPENVTVTTSGGSTATIGDLSDGETVTSDIDVSSGDSSLSVSGDGIGTVDYTLSYTERTATVDPSVDVDGDGTTDVSWSGIYQSGESTTTKSISSLSSGSNSLSTSTASGPQPSWTVSYSEVTATVDPRLDIGGDGSIEASHTGILQPGETVTVPLNNLSTTDTSAQVLLEGGSVSVDIAYTERVRTLDAGVVINGNRLRMTGPLRDGNSTTLTGNSSWLQSGENTVEVRAGDGSLSADAPDRTVNMTYRHDLTSNRAVEYSDESFSERYNISRTYLSYRQDASLAIPHADNVLTMRGLSYRINSSGNWSEIPESAVTMDGTTLRVDISSLVGGEVAAGTTVQVRSTGSKVDVNNGSIQVVRATPVGFDIESRVQLTEWNDDSWLGLAETSQSNLLHYGANESYSAESDFSELATAHGQRLHFPDATSGSAVGVRAMPLIIEPLSGSVHITVPEGQNGTSPRFYVDPGPSSGDSFNVTYVGASEGVWYGAFETGTSQRFDRAQGKRTMTITTDDVNSVIEIRETNAPSDDNATSILDAVQKGNLMGMTLLFGSIAMLVIVGRRPESSRAAIGSAATSLSSLVAQLPAIGDRLAGPTESAVQRIGGALVSVGENELLSAALAGAALVAAIQSGYLQVGPELGAMLAVGAIGLGSLLVLLRYDAFTTARWGGIVLPTSVVALQGLGEVDLITAVINSDAFILLVLLVAYVVIQLVREYRANNGPNDDRPQVVIDSDGGSD